MKNVKVYYYKDFEFDTLKFGSPIESHLGTMKKYNLGDRHNQGIRIQFPKVNLIENKEGSLGFHFPENSKGADFFKKLKELNETQLSDNNNLKLYKDGPEDIVYMKYNSNSLYFTEDEYMTTLEDITKNYLGCKAVVIASSEGLWTTENSYGNTWKIEQLKIYS